MIKFLFLSPACLLIFASFLISACSKPALYGTKQSNEPMIRCYEVPVEDAFRATKEALIFRGYSLKQVNENEHSLETYWQPTTSDSHYVDVFTRKDYGTVGAYYRMEVKVTPRGNTACVSMRNVANSLILNLKASRHEEGRIFDKIDDFTRRRDIKVTNIGLQ